MNIYKVRSTIIVVAALLLVGSMIAGLSLPSDIRSNREATLTLFAVITFLCLILSGAVEKTAIAILLYVTSALFLWIFMLLLFTIDPLDRSLLEVPFFFGAIGMALLVVSLLRKLFCNRGLLSK